MKPWLIFLTVALFALGAFLLSCAGDDDDDNDDCDCDDDDDDTADDDDNGAADDDAGDDDDTFGTGAGAQQCLDDLKPPFYDCRAVCDEAKEEEMCNYYHCIYGCFGEMFDGALACAQAYPELADMVDYWQCNSDCDAAFRTCVEPLVDCDFDIMVVCLDELQTCETGCSVGSPL